MEVFGSQLSFCHVGPGGGAQIVRVGSSHLDLLSHLAGPLEPFSMQN